MAASSSHRSARSTFPRACVLLLLATLAPACAEEKPAPKVAARDATPTPPAAAANPGAAQAKDPKKKSEDSATLAFQQAQMLLLKGEPEKAEAELSRAVTLNPRMSEGFYELGKLQVNLSSRGRNGEGRDAAYLERGIASLAQAVTLEPSNDDYLYWLGRAYSLKDDHPAAIRELEKAVGINPKNAQAWKRLGLVHVEAGHTEQARDSFAKAIEADGSDSGVHFQLGKALASLGDKPGARAAFEKAIEVDPTDPEYYRHLAALLHELGDEPAAKQAEAGLSEWEGYAAKLARRMRAVNQKPNDAAALRRLGEMYYDVGKWTEAEEWFLKAIQVDPKDALAHTYCGSTRRQLKQYEAATNHLKEAEFLAPDNLDAKLELIRLYSDMGQADNLAAMVKTVESAGEKKGDWLFFLGEVCQEIGRADDATRLFEKARALGVTAAPAEAATTEGQ